MLFEVKFYLIESTEMLPSQQSYVIILHGHLPLEPKA
jgi:hypothetical protein